jgi:hypothetical protein
MNKTIRFSLLTLLVMLCGTVFADSYTADFNTAITTSDHAFQVASNWRHIVSTYTNYWDEESYVSYSYSATAGVDGSGALSCSTNQNSNKTYDLLVTPVVKGTVTIAAKTTGNYYTPQLSFFKITDNGDGTFTRGDQITVDVSAINASDYTTITIPVAEAGERIGIRSSYVWLDNFTATDATIIPEKKITIASAVPTATTGILKWDQQANGKVLVSYTVTVTNVGDVDLTQGTEGFSVSIINRATGDVYGTVPVPQDLAKGETSEAFAVSAEVESTLWPNSYTYINMDLKENLFGSTVQRAQSTYNAYEPKFVFRAFDSSSTSSISTAESWGTITESTTKNFEIFNSGTAPLTIKSITLPEGFTSTNKPEIPEGGLVIAKGEKQALSITHNAAATGTFIGTLTIVYLDKDNAEQTYTLDFSATVIGENTWVADFNNTKSSPNYPAGSIAEAGTYYDYQYISSNNYNNWLAGRNTSSYATENNKFITPKLHAAAGEKLAFDVKAGYSTTDEYFVKVYVSTDRKTWGDPVETYAYSTVGSNFTTKTITFETEGDYYVAFALYGNSSAIDNIIGLTKVNVAHDLYIKSVKWPDASVKSGTALQVPSVDIIPLTDESADAYTVKYIYGENVVNIDSKALTASASSSTSFSAAFTPVVETTTTYPGSKVVFEFTDGIKFETEGFDLTVTNEPIFHFLDSKPSSKWNEPKDRTAPITFGKVNAVKEQSFVIFNWGSAPLTVNSITLPEGFSTTTEFPLTVAAFDGENSGIDAASQALTITFSATEANTYSGDMVITYSGDKTFTLPISGTMLDPTKFYANFGSESNQWPVGSVYQSNVSTTYVNTGDYALTSSSTTSNIFITPKLTAAAGDKLLFDAKLYNSSWSEGKVVVYAATTREAILDFDPENDTRTPLFSVSGRDETAPMTTDFQTFEVTVPEAGDYYFGFEISGRPYVDEIYGLKTAAVAHDWMIASSNIPTEAMQNIPSAATVNILNLGLAAEEADSYTVTAFIDGKATSTGTAVALPTTNKLSDAGTQLTVGIQSPKVGTFPVYIEVKAGDYSIATEPVNVVFTAEVAKSELTATADGTSSNSPLNLSYYNSESVSLYTADVLANSYGLTSGAKIKSITFKGYKTTAQTKSTFNLWYEWSDDAEQAKPADGLYPTEGLTQLIADQEKTWPEAGSATELADFITLTFAEPIVYEAGKALRIVMRSNSDDWKAANFEKSTSATSGLTYYHYNDNKSTFESNSWTNTVLPVLHIGLAVEPATISGTVKNNEGAAIENATVTLVSTDGEGVQYEGKTDAEGAYSFNVIQTGRTYNATVVASEDYKTATAEISFAEGSVIKDFVLADTNPLGDANLDGEVTTSDAVAAVTFALEKEVPSEKALKVADVNKSGNITVSDAVGIVNIALNAETPAPARGEMEAVNFLTKNGTSLNLINSTEFVGFQMDVTLAEGAMLNGVSLNDRAANLQVVYNRIAKNTYRIIAFSTGNAAIEGNEGELISLNITGNDNIAISNIEFADAAANAYALSLTETTGINGIYAGAANVESYTVGGVKNDKVRKGMNIVRTADGKVKKVLVK